jgi:pimeloyl-ACP methyl ester carboxylesterase
MPAASGHIAYAWMWPRSAAATQPGLSPDDLCAVTARTLVLTGDDDLVTLDRTLALYRALPTAELAVLPDASHLLLMEHGGAVRGMVLKFLTTNAAPAYMPIARAGPELPLRGAGVLAGRG